MASSASCSTSSTSNRPYDAESSCSSEEPRKKRVLFSRSVDKWITEHDKDLQTASWLKYDVVSRDQVDCRKCSVLLSLKISCQASETITQRSLIAHEIFVRQISRIMPVL